MNLYKILDNIKKLEYNKDKEAAVNGRPDVLYVLRPSSSNK